MTTLTAEAVLGDMLATKTSELPQLNVYAKHYWWSWRSSPEAACCLSPGRYWHSRSRR